MRCIQRFAQGGAYARRAHGSRYKEWRLRQLPPRPMAKKKVRRRQQAALVSLMSNDKYAAAMPYRHFAARRCHAAAAQRQRHRSYVTPSRRDAYRRATLLYDAALAAAACQTARLMKAAEAMIYATIYAILIAC